MRVALLLAFSVAAWAVEPRLPEIRIEPTAGGSVIYVHNPMTQPLTAICLATAENPFWEDEIREPIPPGAEKRIEIDHSGPVKVQAALYADGSYAGDKQMGGPLRESRRFTLDTARSLIVTLQKAEKLNTPKATVAGDLKVQADTLRVQPNRRAAQALILRTIRQLNGTKSYSDVAVDLLKEESDIATSKQPAV